MFPSGLYKLLLYSDNFFFTTLNSYSINESNNEFNVTNANKQLQSIATVPRRNNNVFMSGSVDEESSNWPKERKPVDSSNDTSVSGHSGINQRLKYFQ